jgi:hypothetical protein
VTEVGGRGSSLGSRRVKIHSGVVSMTWWEIWGEWMMMMVAVMMLAGMDDRCYKGEGVAMGLFVTSRY